MPPSPSPHPLLHQEPQGVATPASRGPRIQSYLGHRIPQIDSGTWPDAGPRGKLSRVDTPALTWVIVAGRPRRVSDFANLAPRKRPPATCPECGRALTLKLGRVRRHHAAHAPNVLCAATQPETALHVNLKLYLAAQLGSAAGKGFELRILRRCEGAGCQPCDEVREDVWLRDWDDVAVEARVEARVASAERHRRPDVVLLRAGQPVGAIEVLVSHAVSEQKAESLAHARIPWVEVRATEQLFDTESGWRAGHPLPVERTGSADGPGAWRCEAHLRREIVLAAARVVDVYRPGGVRDRAIYRVEEHLVEGQTHALALRRDGREIARETADSSRASRRSAWTKLRGMYAADVASLTGDGGAFSDSPMRWATGDAAANLVHEALADLQPGDATPLATRYPRRWYFARERGEWFLPRDTQDVRWDRGDPDAFAAHPAWAASRAVVRERPAPEGSWSSFIFASRPSAAAFGVRGGVTRDGPLAIVALDTADGAAPRALVVLEATADDERVRRVAGTFGDAGVESLWLSHPLDWSAARSDLAWAASGRDSRGRCVVLVDGLGVYRADAFVRAFQRGDSRLHPEAIRARMAERVARLSSASPRSRRA